MNAVPRPALSSLVREQINRPSPIRQIMKMAERQNILAMGLDPAQVISFGGGWVNHSSPDEFRQADESVVAGTVTESARDDRPVEFPTLDDRLVGRPSRHLYTVSDSGGAAAIVAYDEAGGVRTHQLGPDVVAGEAVFVPGSDTAAENDGWLLTITTRRDATASQLLVLDASDVAGAPVAAVTLPRGVPSGFHGSWIADPSDAEKGIR